MLRRVHAYMRVIYTAQIRPSLPLHPTLRFKVKNSNKRLRWNLLWQVGVLAAFFPVLSFVPGKPRTQ